MAINMTMLAMYALRLKTEYRNYVKFGMLSLAIVIVLYFMNFFPTVHNPFDGSSSFFAGQKTCESQEAEHLQLAHKCSYRFKYPLSNPRLVTSGISYKIAIISDLDEERSKVDSYTWKSYLKYGHLVKYDNGKYAVDWEDRVEMRSRLNEKGRGFELSELCAFNGKLYTVDDRTGIIYQIANDNAVPWVILQDGNGMSRKGFKGEWMTVKEGALYVGGLGKEWTTKEGVFVNYDPLFVKSISPNGAVVHHNWTDHYLNVRAVAGIHFPGYMIHEAVAWSHVKKRWYFLPRRMSTLQYNDQDDETRGTNVMISCNAHFKDYHMVRIGELKKTRGFSSFKFVPGTGDNVAVALKSEEVNGNINSYVTIFHVETGKVLLAETFIESEKYEGIEFV